MMGFTDPKDSEIKRLLIRAEKAEDALRDAERKGRDLCQQNGELLMLIADFDRDHHALRGTKTRLDGHEACALCERIEHAFGMDRKDTQ